MSKESRILQILDSSLDAVVTIDSEGKVVHWNDQAERIFGWTRCEVFERRLSELIIPEKFVKQHEQGMKHYLRTGEGPVLGRRIEIEGQNKAGEIFPIELSISPVRVDNDAAGFTGFIRDLRGLKDRECQLRLYDERVRKIVDSSQDGFWDIQMSKVGSGLSDRCSTMLGYSAGYLSEVPPHESEMLHPQDRARVEAAWMSIRHPTLPKHSGRTSTKECIRTSTTWPVAVAMAMAMTLLPLPHRIVLRRRKTTV